MWSINEQALSAWTTDPLVPDEVLYEFDGPLTFTAKFGPFKGLFHKIGEREKAHFFSVVKADDIVIAALKAGQLSVRGALKAPDIFIIECNTELVVQRYWICNDEDFPEKLLPAHNVGLFSYFPPTPDSIEQANAYFSVAFTGRELHNKSIPFQLLKSLIDATYDAARRVLSPLFMAGAKSATFDFPARAIPGSLILTLDEPIINDANLKRRTAESPVSVEDARASFAKQRQTFFDETEELVQEANKGRISDNLAKDRFTLLDNLQQIIPSDQNKIEQVFFSAKRSDGAVQTVAVNEKAGTTLHRAFKRIERQSVIDIGRVEIINSKSRTFVYRSSRGKQVTCHLANDIFDTNVASNVLRNGSEVRIKGHLKKRQKRDVMHADYAEILPPPPRG